MMACLHLLEPLFFTARLAGFPKHSLFTEGKASLGSSGLKDSRRRRTVQEAWQHKR